MTGILLHAQTKMNTLKTDLFTPFFPAAVLKYERVLSEDISVQMGVLYGELPPPPFTGGIRGSNATGFCITPELRYFPFHKRPAPKGIYLAPNFRYQRFLTVNIENGSPPTEKE